MGNILHNLLENASAKTSTERQINTDKPEEAPKETKEALVKKVQKPEVPHKEHIKESAGEPGTQYRVVVYTPFGQIDVDVDANSEEEANEVAVNKVKDAFQDEYKSEIRAAKVIKLTETEELVEDISSEDKLQELQNRVAGLQDYLDNTPEIADDERQAIQSEIDELLDEINYFENGLPEIEEPSEDDLHLGESALTEAPNPENDDINKKILSTIRTKSDVEPRYKSDLEAAGLKVEPNKYENSWNVIGSNGRKLSKDAFMGGKSARFNSNNNKVADYYNMLTKEVDNDKNWQNKDLRNSKPIQRQDKWHHYNKETHEWEPGTDYSRKEYDRRQRNSMGYNFDDLRGGSKDIRDYKQAQGNEDFHSRAKGWSQDDVDSANKKLADFQASISDKIAELQRNIDRAKENYNSHVSGEEQAKQAKQDILNRKREARNK